MDKLKQSEKNIINKILVKMMSGQNKQEEPQKVSSERKFIQETHPPENEENYRTPVFQLSFLNDMYREFSKKPKVEKALDAIFSGKKKFMVIGLLLIIVISTLFQSFFPWNADKDKTFIDLQASEGEGSSIQFITVKKADVSDVLEIHGQIVFYEKVSLSSKVSGRLEKLYIQEGMKVDKGDLLAEVERLPLQLTLKQQLAELEISIRSYALSKAKYENALKSIEIKLKTIEKARADLEDKRVSYVNMDRILNNKKVLYDAGGISESDLETLKAQHKTSFTKYELARSDLEIQQVGFRDQDIIIEGYAVPKNMKERMDLLKRINTKIERAELEAAGSKIEQVKENIESTRMLIRETYIRSPLVGVVASKNMEAGEMIKEDSVIATLVNIGRVFVSMNINEKDIKKVEEGQTVNFTVDAMGDEVFQAKIERITPVLDVKTRTVEIKAAMDNPKYRLLPGMFARARIICGTKKDVITVPVSSLAKKEDKTGELYLLKKGIIFKQKVALGNEYKSDVEIAEGIIPGDVVISSGANLVYPGMKLEEKKGK